MGRVKDEFITGVELVEGSKCPDTDCNGTMEYPPVGNCSCHISPPCGKCVDNPLTCSVCGLELDG